MTPIDLIRCGEIGQKDLKILIRALVVGGGKEDSVRKSKGELEIVPQNPAKSPPTAAILPIHQHLQYLKRV
jgi:hypothetical protein